MKIPVFSSSIRRKEMDSVLTCMVSEKIGPGDMNAKFVQQVKEFFDVEGAVAFRTPSLALRYALQALNLPMGSYVMISALAPIWHIVTIEELGYKPLILDVDLKTAQVTFENVKYGIAKGGRVLLLSETLGFLPNFNDLLSLDIPIVEDVSLSVGSSIKNQKVGTFGVFSILCLEEEDTLTGGGGAVLFAKDVRNWTCLENILENVLDTNILPDMNCALAYVQLKEFARNESVRKEIFDLYMRSLMQGRHATFEKVNEETEQTVYSFPVVLSDGVKDVMQYTAKKEIDISMAFKNSVIASREKELTDCVNAKSLLLRTVLFPLYPRLGNTNVAKIAKVLATLP